MVRLCDLRLPAIADDCPCEYHHASTAAPQANENRKLLTQIRMPLNRRSMTLWIASTLCVMACDGRSAPKRLYHPAEIVGRWSREVPDVHAGDTLELKPDGTAIGFVDGIPRTAQWVVTDGPAGSRVFCASASDGSSCRTFQISADILILDGGPYGKTIFHRVP